MPSPSESRKPASITSRQPSPSESRSKLFITPSPSSSPLVSSTSKIPSLSSSKSMMSGTLSLSLSGITVSSAADEKALSVQKTADDTITLKRVPSIICRTLSTVKVDESTPE